MILWAPLLVIGLSYVAALYASRVESRRWNWITPALLYWSLMVLITILLAPVDAYGDWFSAPAGHGGWALLASGIGLAHLPFLFVNRRVLRSWPALIVWLLFGLVNGLLEELFWRGLVLHSLSGWAPWLAVLVTGLLFALHHPFTFGPVSVANRHPVTIGGALLFGIAWGWVALRTGSLWWPVVGHVLVNLGEMAGPVLMGVVTPLFFQKRPTTT